jgi:hypothetical protein
MRCLEKAASTKVNNGEQRKLTEAKPGELLKRSFNMLFETLVHSSEVISRRRSPVVYPEVDS